MTKDKKIKVAIIILKTIAAVGVLSMAIAAPNALQALNIFYKKDKRKYNKASYVKRSITKLKDNGMIEFVDKNGKKFIRLTQKGKYKLLKYQIGELKIKKPKIWDKKWRIIIFDIKETKKNIRNIVRQELVNLGFIRLQNSVWVFPYECEEIIIMLKSNLKIGKDILYITADNIENDKWLKKEFNL